MGPRLNSRGILDEQFGFFPAAQASMGPRLNSRGIGGKPGAPDPVPDRFNGAAAEQPRNLVVPNAGEVRELASMGPRLNSRGIGWGRTRRATPLGASMGPRLNSRGILAAALEKADALALQWGRG